MLKPRFHVIAATLLLPTLAAPATAAARGPDFRQAARAEASACSGIAGDAVPLQRGTVESVTPLYQRMRSGRQLSGATLTVRVEPASASQLERALACRIARCAARPTADGCPLAVQGVRSRVVAEAGTLKVQLWSDHLGAGEVILARARGLASGAEH